LPNFAIISQYLNFVNGISWNIFGRQFRIAIEEIFPFYHHFSNSLPFYLNFAVIVNLHSWEIFHNIPQFFFISPIKRVGIICNCISFYSYRHFVDNFYPIKLIGLRMTPAIRRHIKESKERFSARADKLGAYKAEMTKLHRAAREKLDQTQNREWDLETLARAKRLPKGLRGLWHRLTGKYQKVRKQNEAEAQATRKRHARARQELIEKQREQRALLQERIQELRRAQAGELRALRKDIGRYLKLAGGRRRSETARGASLGLKLQR